MMTIRLNILNIPLDFVSKTQALDKVDSALKSEGRFFIVTPNPEFLIDSLTNPEFKHALLSSDLAIPDGNGLVFAKNYLNLVSDVKTSLLRPVLALFMGIKAIIVTIRSKTDLSLTGTDFVIDLIEAFPNSSFYFAGTRYQDNLESADELIKALQQRFPFAKFVGSVSLRQKTEDGNYFDTDNALVEQKIASDLASFGLKQADFLILGIGTPRQELWIYKNKDRLPFKVFMGVGGAFEFLRGAKPRAPYLVRKARLEWLFRLLCEFSFQRAKRILKAFPLFPLYVYFDSIKTR